MTRRAIALVSCWVALGGVTVFGPSPVPAEEIEIREKPPQFQRADDGEVIPVVVVVDGATIRRAPSRVAKSVGKAKYLTSYSLIDSADDYYLAGVMDDGWEAPETIAGWFHKDDVLIERQAIREKKGIFLKGIVINQWREAGSGGVSIRGAELLQGPGEDFETVGEIGLFSFYFIYKKHERPGASYYLLGGSPILGNVLRPGETLEGWVDASRLVEWPTRQAVQFDKDTLAQRVESGTGEGVRIFP
ncbi:MAG: hypothetical protein AAGE94_18745, partial [Acidobacteriota bacterium]